MSMTARERFDLLLSGKPVHPGLVFPMVGANHAARIAGHKLKATITDARTLAAVLLNAYQEYGYDLIMVFTDTMVEAEALGCQVAIPEDDDPYLVASFQSAEADPEASSADYADCTDCESAKSADKNPSVEWRETAGRIPAMLEAIRLIVAQTRGEVPVLASLKGPLSLACFLTGVEQFLTDLRTAPERCHETLRRTSTVQEHYLNAIIESGGIPFIGDPLASGDIISRRDFSSFALPYLQQLAAAAGKRHAPCGLHICGDTMDRLDLMGETGAAILSVDEMDISVARQKLGSGAILMGNVSTSLLAQGSSAEVRQAARHCLAAAGPALILSSGCDVPRDAPKENVAAIVDAIRETDSPQSR